jgi:hypothetical protein
MRAKSPHLYPEAPARAGRLPADEYRPAATRHIASGRAGSIRRPVADYVVTVLCPTFCQ